VLVGEVRVAGSNAEGEREGRRGAGNALFVRNNEAKI